MRRSGQDVAVSDMVGTLLLVLAVVLAGGGLTAVVAANLQVTPPPSASLSLASASAGDTTLRLALRSGDTLALSELRLLLQRGGNQTAVPQVSWTTPNATLLRPGESITFPVAPAIAAGETVRVTVLHATANAQLAALTTLAPANATPLPAPTLVAAATPSSIIADAATASLLTVRVSHPLGALGVASLRANLTNLSIAAKSANATLTLRDEGTEGDAFGGDGVYSALLRAAINTTPGNYTIPITAFDIAGYPAATTSVNLNVTANLTGLLGNLTGSGGGNLTVGEIANLSAAVANISVLGNLTLLLANLTGQTPGAAVLNGTVASEGVRLAVPTSQNISTFLLRNFSWERHNPALLQYDAAVFRILGGGGYAWSAYLKFDYISNTPSITRLEMWNANSTAGRTVYLPAANGRVSMVDLTLNMTNPTQSGFTCSAVCSPPTTYQNANIQGRPVFIISWMRDEFNNPDASDLGIISVETVFA